MGKTPRFLWGKRRTAEEVPGPERIFDWVSSHDEKSREYDIRSVIGTVDRHKKFWRASKIRLDQGREGACVGYGWAAELMARPFEVGGRDNPTIRGMAPREYARLVYKEAQKIDRWPGEGYSGTSVLAGAKMVKQHGFIDSYRWAFGIDDVLDTLVAQGPVVVGIPWHQGMYRTRPSGLVATSRGP
jgi:hypothetical protein